MHNRLTWFIEFGRSYGDHELEFYCHMMRNLESLNAYECLEDKQTCRSLHPNLIGVTKDGEFIVIIVLENIINLQYLIGVVDLAF